MTLLDDLPSSRSSLAVRRGTKPISFRYWPTESLMETFPLGCGGLYPTSHRVKRELPAMSFDIVARKRLFAPVEICPGRKQNVTYHSPSGPNAPCDISHAREAVLASLPGSAAGLAGLSGICPNDGATTRTATTSTSPWSSSTCRTTSPIRAGASSSSAQRASSRSQRGDRVSCEGGATVVYTQDWHPPSPRTSRRTAVCGRSTASGRAGARNCTPISGSRGRWCAREPAARTGTPASRCGIPSPARRSRPGWTSVPGSAASAGSSWRGCAGTYAGHRARRGGRGL